MKARQPLDYDVPTVGDRIGEVPYLLRMVAMLAAAFLFGYWLAGGSL